MTDRKENMRRRRGLCVLILQSNLVCLSREQMNIPAPPFDTNCIADPSVYDCAHASAGCFSSVTAFVRAHLAVSFGVSSGVTWGTAVQLGIAQQIPWLGLV